MHVKILGGESGVYENKGSCIAAAMYCEHERQELMNRGLKPEAFFHQFSDYVSTAEVISRIDNNKRKLKKKEAKFFVLTVSPSAGEQRKMGSTIEERIDAFKNYIRNGVMAEYAKNFERNLSEKDIMYYAYVHVNRGNKEGEQMHGHIIVSRKDINNNINLSPKTTYREGKSFIAHGFDRDRFNQNCEVSFDQMMGYEREYIDSYEFRKLAARKEYSNISDTTEMKIEHQYQTQLGDIDFAVVAEILGANKTDTPQYETTSESIPVSEPVVTETKIPVHQSMGSFIKRIKNEVENFVGGLFRSKEAEQKEVNVSGQDNSESENQQDSVHVKNTVHEVIEPEKRKNKLYLFPDDKKGCWCAVWYNDGKKLFSGNIDDKDVKEYWKAVKSDKPGYKKKVMDDITTKYFVVPLAKRISTDFQKKNKNENITSVNALRNHLGYCWIKHEVDGDWRPGYKIPDELTDDINSLPAQYVNVVFDTVNSLLVDAFPTIACGGAGNNKKRKKEENSRGRTK